MRGVGFQPALDTAFSIAHFALECIKESPQVVSVQMLPNHRLIQMALIFPLS
jgi:hypothetical protein